MNRFPKCFSAAALALLLFSEPGMAGSAAPISGRSPLAGCNVADEYGANYLDSVSEPRLAVNPSNPRRMIAGWQQDLWTWHGARGHVSAFSIDGGKSWQRVVVPGINKCSGGKGRFAFDRTKDPSVAISPNGMAYFASVAFSADASNAILVNRSPPGISYWDNPVMLTRDTGGAQNDRPSLVVDPGNSRYVYVVWDHQGWGSGGQPTYSIQFSRSADGGVTWDPVQTLADAETGTQITGSRGAVLKDGSLLIFYNERNADYTTSTHFVRSTDHGRSFGPLSDALFGAQEWGGTFLPNTRNQIKDATFLFDVAADPGAARIYLVWQDFRPRTGNTGIALAMSRDGGATWSEPVTVNKTPTSSNPLLNQAFIPSVGVAADGGVFVGHYDFRNDTAKDAKKKLTDYWVVSCRAGADCSKASSWGKESRLTLRSFNMLLAPALNPYGADIGARQALAPLGTGVRALFTLPTAPYTSSIASGAVR